MGKYFLAITPAHPGHRRSSPAIFSTHALLIEMQQGLPKLGAPLNNICFALLGSLELACIFSPACSAVHRGLDHDYLASPKELQALA